MTQVVGGQVRWVLGLVDRLTSVLPWLRTREQISGLSFLFGALCLAVSTTSALAQTPAPVITSVAPNSGPTAGGTSVTISGSNFVGATSVTFGGAQAAGFTVDSANSITAATPAGSGTVSVTVTTPSGMATLGSGYTYAAPAPPTANSQSVTTASQTAVAITLTGTNATSFTVVTAPAHGTLTGTAPSLTYTPVASFSGADSFNFTASNASGTSAPATVSITVNAPVVISLAPASVPNGTVGVAYSQTFAASGGTGPYNFAITAGALPAGMTLSPAGSLSGVPTAGGTFNFTVTARDANNSTGTRSYSFTINAATIFVAPATLPNGTANQAYSQTITASGGTAPYSYAITAGALPSGLTLAANGTISGTPTQFGSFTFTVRANDSSTGSGPYSGSRSYTLAIGAPTITLAPATLPGSMAGQAYSQTVTASGGTAPYTFAVTAGALPNGLSLTAGGTINGTPTTGGTFNFTLTATDANGNSGTRGYTLTVAAPTIAVAPVTLPPGMVSQAYSQTLTASGGTGSYTFAVTAGALPPGVTLAAGGTLSGTPTANGAFNFTVTATDANGNTGARAYALTIAPPNVVAAATTTTLSSSPNPSRAGQAVTLTASVSSAGGTPTGTVTFTSGSTDLGSAPLVNGTATLATSALPIGTNALTATYSGAAAFITSTGSASQTVTSGTTTTALTVSPNPSTFGQSVTFTAIVTGQNPTGTVSFQDGGTVLGTVALVNGRASFSTAALAVGSHSITAVYGGDNNNGTSTSAAVSQSVNAASTTTPLASSQNPSAIGQTIRFTATVSASGGTPTGSVSFRDGGTVLGSAVLAGGSATFATASLPVGTRTITAVYSGDATYATSTSAPLAQSISAVVGGITLTVVSGGRDGSFGFSSTLPGAASFTLTSSGNRITRSFDHVPAGTYSITSLGLPMGFALQGFTCSSGTNANNSVTFTVAPGTRVSCSFTAGFDEEGVRRTTQAAIRSFIQQRAEAIAQAQPETRRFHDRLTGAVLGTDGATGLIPTYSASPVEFTGSTVLGGTNITASTSLSRFLRPTEKLEYDAWAEVRSGSYRDTVDSNPLTAGPIGPRSRTNGSFTLAFVGLDYRIQPGILIGLLGQYDQVSQDSLSLGTKASGIGFMVGPYMSMALTPSLFFDARLAYGTSSNLITPPGLAQSSFSTDRMLYRAELSGLYRFGGLSMLPSVAALYFSETQHAFTDALSVRIPSQQVGLGQLAVGPEFAYDLPLDRGLLVPRFAVRAIYNFLRDDAASAALGIVQPTGPLRARVEGGLDLQDYYGFTVGASVAYDGIGDKQYSATSGRLSVRRPF